MARLPTEPNGVSARAAKAATPAGSAYTGRSSDGTSQGRLATTRTAPATATDLTAWPGVPRRRVAGPAAPRAAAGTATRAVTASAANPPAAAGTSASASRPAPRQDGPGPR